MSPSFYYADANSQPVGPLSLEEIRRFVAAGVIPRDVLVCQADGEQWRELDSFTTGKKAPPKAGPVPPASEPSPERAARSLGAHFNHAVCAAAIFLILNLISLGAASDDNGSAPYVFLSIFLAVAALWALATEAVFIFKLCKVLPRNLLFSTPGKATGFLFIPGFNLYWAFQLFPGLATAAIQWREQRDASTRPPTWLVHLGYVVAILFGFVSVVSFLELVGATPISLAGVLLYLLDYGLRLSFYSMLIGEVQLIFGPGSKPRPVSMMLMDTDKIPRPIVWGCNVLLPTVSGVILLIAIITRIIGALIP